MGHPRGTGGGRPNGWTKEASLESSGKDNDSLLQHNVHRLIEAGESGDCPL